ncbi:MAG: hypothetical protein ACFFB5_02215 [Promethearchaeota archaeon]
MNDSHVHKAFKIRFLDKTVWNDIKVDLKAKLRENDILFQYSEKTPTFHVLYKSDMIEIRVTWEEEILLFNLLTKKSISSEQIKACREIYDLLILFSGELVSGNSPYNW